MKKCVTAIVVFIHLLFPASLLPGCQSTSQIEADATKIISFETEEMTSPHVDISPDGSTILFDVLGDLYTVPIQGGEATLLVGGNSWDVMGKYGPDGKSIAFVSDRKGKINLHTLQTDGSNIEEYDVGRYRFEESVRVIWNPNGGLINLVDKELVSMISPENKRPFAEQLDSNKKEAIYYTGSLSADGRYAYVISSGITRIDLSSGEEIQLDINLEPGSIKTIKMPLIAVDGKRLAYVVNNYIQGAGEYCSLHIHNMETGKSEELTDSLVCHMTPDFAFTPDSKSIVTARLGKLIRIDITTGESNIIPVKVPIKKEITAPLHHQPKKIAEEIKTKVIRWPTVEEQSNQLVYSAFGKLYTTDISTNETRRLTTATVFEYAPALSPDGKWVAYVSWADAKMGHIMLVPLNGGTPKQLTKIPGRYTNPVWSPDGTKLTFISDKTESRMGLQSQHQGTNYTGYKLSLNWMSVFEGNQLNEMAAHAVIAEITPTAVDPGRFYPIPSFSADGKRVVVGTYKKYQENEKYGPALLSVNLDGSDMKYQALLPEADEVVPISSPDSRRMAIVKADKLWVTDIPSASDETAIPEVDLATAILVNEDAPAYVSWQDNENLVWANTNKIYQYNLRTQETRQLTDINLRKPKPVPQGSYALVNARIITMNGDEVIEKGSVVVRNNLIMAVGDIDEASIPENTQRINLEGKTIIPGLIDVHGHIQLGSKELWQKQNWSYIGNLAYGVTTVYDPSANTKDVFGQSEMVEIGEILAPRIYSSGSPILGQSGTTPFRDIQSLEDADAVVKPYAKYEHVGPLKEYNQPYREQRQWLRESAEKNGVLLTSHYTGAGFIYNGLTRIADGFTAIEHELSADPIYEDIAKFVAASGVHYTPTLMVSPGIGGRYSNKINPDDEKLNRLNPKFIIEKEIDRFMKPGQQQMRELYASELLRASKALAAIVQEGGLVSIGGHGNGLPGLGSHWEMWAFTLGGMLPHEALRAATLNGAKKLDLHEELGSIEKGKLADLVVLNSNPLEDIQNSADIHYIIKNGFVYDDETMTRIWPTHKELDPWPWQADEQREK